MNLIKTQCFCGQVSIRLNLIEPLESYCLRQCDCDFCMNKGIYYLSDPAVNIQLVTTQSLKKQQQGSLQSDFLLCANCDNVIGVTYMFGSELKGAINASLIKEKLINQNIINVSPKLLNASEKVKRWNKVWSPMTILIE